VLCSVLGIAVLAYVCEFLLLRRVSNNPLSAFLITLGVLIILSQLTVDIFSTLPHQAVSPFNRVLDIGGVRISESAIVVIVLAGLTALGVFLVLRLTAAGRRARASAEDGDAALHVGVPVRRVASATFVLGSALAGWAGCLLAMLYPLSAESGEQYLIQGFSVALVGGLGVVYGGVVAALLLGLTEELAAAYWQPEWVPALSVLLIIGILVVRPAGLFGTPSRWTPGGGAFLPPLVRTPRQMWIVVPVLFMFALAVPSLGLSPAAMSLAVFAAIFAIMASGVGFLFRLTGRLSFGHGAFWLLGSYWAGIAVSRWDLGFWPIIAGAIGIGVLSGLLIALPVMRTRGFSFLIVSFAVADLAAIVATNLSSLTGGTQGLSALAEPGKVFGFDIDNQDALYRLIVIVGGVLLVLLFLVERSKFGRRLSTVRENPALAQSLGLNVFLHEVGAFCLSAVVVAVAGVLYLYQSNALSPLEFTGEATVTITLMVVLGGGRVLLGPPVGAVVLTFLPLWLNFGPRGTQYAEGIALIVILLVLPQGVVPGLVDLPRRVRLLLRRGRFQPAPFPSNEGSPTPTDAIPPVEVPSSPTTDQLTR
jgi:branched-chain amino acid transport system permease protein